jgi:Fe2+ or Zn2+ uptake regulation protein
MPRPSHVRDAVKQQLRLSGRHSWTVEEMLVGLRRGGISADFSSVFRGLVWCEEQGLVARIDLGDGKSRYELAQDHHEHVRCEKCGNVAEVPGCLVDDAARRMQALTGYQVRAHSLVFTGLCPDCQ